MTTLAFLLFLSIIPGQLSRPAVPDAAKGEIETFAKQLEEDVAADGIGSIAAAVAKDEAIVWQGAFGWADAGVKTRATPEHIYRIGSITKSFTATLLVLLADEGVLSLDDRAATYLPEVSEIPDAGSRGGTITLRQLACHTSGLVREPTLANAASGPIAIWEDQVLASIPKTKLLSAPGKEYSTRTSATRSWASPRRARQARSSSR
jgi:D-alanyl-D-alanine carboxypeptidase